MPLSNINLWIVDDETQMRGMLRDFLTSLGYSVRCFSNAVDALTALHKDGPPNAVISHIRMRPMTGINFLRIARRDFPDLPVLLFSGAGDAAEKQEALRLASDFLAKPFPLTELKAKIELVLAAPKPDPAKKKA